MARYTDPYADLGKTRSETADQARKRRAKTYEREVYDKAIFIAQNDPEINGDMRKARAKARELLAIENRVNQGIAEGGSPEKTLNDRPRSKSREVPTSTRRKSSPSKTTRRRAVVRTVAAPFGSTASAGWTFFQGGLSLVLLYVVLRDADAIGDLVRGVSTGIRRITDPRIPLLPSRDEATPPLRVIGGRSRRNAQQAAPTTSGTGTYGDKPLV